MNALEDFVVIVQYLSTALYVIRLNNLDAILKYIYMK